MPDLSRLEDDIAAREGAAPDLRSGLESYLVWAPGRERQKAPLSLVYLHGFSASPPETRPLFEQVAGALGAHLYVPRLCGHGATGRALGAARAEDWLEDTREAIRVASALGERVVLAGCSTGATLALWLAAQAASAPLAALVLLAPNFRPRNPVSLLLGRPGGRLLARLAFGRERRVEPVHDAHAALWTTAYPPSALCEMMRVVDLARAADLARVAVPSLFVYSPRDQVVALELIESRFADLGASRKRLIRFKDTADPSHHVLAGDAFSPDSTAPLAADITDFLRGEAGLRG